MQFEHKPLADTHSAAEYRELQQGSVGIDERTRAPWGLALAFEVVI